MNIPSPARRLNKSEQLQKHLQKHLQNKNTLEINGDFITFYDELVFNEALALIINNKYMIIVSYILIKFQLNFLDTIKLLNIIESIETHEQNEKKKIYNPENLNNLIDKWTNDTRDMCIVTSEHINYYDISKPPYLNLMARKINGKLYHNNCVCDVKNHKSSAKPFCADPNKVSHPVSIKCCFKNFVNINLVVDDIFKKLIQNIYNEKIKHSMKSDAYLTPDIFEQIYTYRFTRDQHKLTNTSLKHNLTIFTYRINSVTEDNQLLTKVMEEFKLQTKTQIDFSDVDDAYRNLRLRHRADATF